MSRQLVIISVAVDLRPALAVAAARAARIEVARRVLDRAEEVVIKRRGWSTPRQADRYAASLRKRDAALARLEKLEPTTT